jgi:chemotaxis signal transduction protein
MDKHADKEVFLSFRLGKELFAVTVKKVLEVLQKQQLTEVPETPARPSTESGEAGCGPDRRT